MKCEFGLLSGGMHGTTVEMFGKVPATNHLSGRAAEGRVKCVEEAIEVHPERQEEIRKRVVSAAEAALAHHHYVSAVDVLIGAGFLQPAKFLAWKKGRVDFLERVIQMNLKRISLSMYFFRQWARARGLKPSETRYVRDGRGATVELRFSKSGDRDIERNYRTHYVSPALAENKKKRLAQKVEAPTPAVEVSECVTDISQV